MANSWLRLWHDMPNDPKWRTIARVSKQSIPAVLSVYVHLLVIASNATERGRTQNVCSEDLASALDLDAEQIDAILAAMQGRVLDGDMVSGWAKRQVEREDGSAERAKRWREAQKEAKQAQANATERKRTPDKDTDTDINPSSPGKPDDGFEEFWKAYPKRKAKGAAMKAWSKIKAKADTLQAITTALAWQRTSADWTKDAGQFIPYPASYLNAQGWLDEAPAGAPSATAIPFDRAAYDAKRKADMAAAREAYKREQAESMIPVRAAK